MKKEKLEALQVLIDRYERYVKILSEKREPCDIDYYTEISVYVGKGSKFTCVVCSTVNGSCKSCLWNVDEVRKKFPKMDIRFNENNEHNIFPSNDLNDTFCITKTYQELSVFNENVGTCDEEIKQAVENRIRTLKEVQSIITKENKND